MKIEHVALYVSDLERAKTFFVTYFQAVPNTKYQNPKTGFSSYFLQFEDGARLELMWKPQLEFPEKSLNRAGYAHLAFQLGSRDAVDQLTKRLLQDGYQVISGPRITGDGYYESCILDLEGNQIELTV